MPQLYPTHIVSHADRLSFDELQEILSERLIDISPNPDKETQTELGRMFEALADLTDNDAALAKMQDLGLL